MIWLCASVILIDMHIVMSMDGIVWVRGIVEEECYLFCLENLLCVKYMV